MKTRLNQGATPQITFTSDFHELVQGDLVYGPCKLRYDPLRLLTSDHRGTQHKINAHLVFHPSGQEWHGEMTLPAEAPLGQLVDASAHKGVMLETTFSIPEGCEEIEAWFSCEHPDGDTHWDSNLDKNFRLRFGLHDLTIEKAIVVSTKKSPCDWLDIAVDTSSAVDTLSIRWHSPSHPAEPRHQTALSQTTQTKDKKSWSLPDKQIVIPKGATLAFDLIYTVDGNKFTDDNQGRWYIAD
ncbi:hypothetical protein [Persicirhabdus sediminis]|uniref:Uncharacterized protein n=1 Tax=Persicirhabdus sediminis TaxID=454144 RepID=A0A8J7SJH5_9BACT|nr:hypothetical protein [Persicirhabdus sediminis]MBK1790165.1 hypothetical protein [Persicirhabdus sediminis]